MIYIVLFQDILNLQYTTVKYTLHLFNFMISEYKKGAKNVIIHELNS